MKVAFKALIKQMTIKSLVCGEKEAQLILRLQDDNVKNEILNALNSLQQADQTVYVVIMKEKKESLK